MRLIAGDGVLGERTFAPGVGTANPMDAQVDIEVDEASALQLIGMLHREVFLPIIPSTDTQRLATVDF